MSDCVIFVQAIEGLQRSMKSFQCALQEHRYTIVNGFHPREGENITNVAKQFYDLVRVHAEVHTRIHFVTYSVGALILRRMLRLYEPDTILGCMVMVAPCNQADAVSRMMHKFPGLKNVLGQLDVDKVDPAYLDRICAMPTRNVMVIAGRGRVSLGQPVLSLRSHFSGKPNDGLIKVSETRLPEMDAFLEVAETHKSITENAMAISETVRFIKEHSGDEHVGVNDIYTTLLLNIRENRDLLAALGPAVAPRGKTSGGGVFWRDLAVVSGWRFQENTVTSQCRILDADNNALVRAPRSFILETYNGLTRQRDL